LNFVSNTVEGFLRAALEPTAVGRTINLGSGREISIGDLAVLIGRLMDCPLHVVSEGQRVRPEKSEVERLLASNELAASLLNWHPAVGLEEGLRRTIDWVRANREKYRSNSYTI
jgi:dTDP-glucose 4,6-dehydratase